MHMHHSHRLLGATIGVSRRGRALRGAVLATALCLTAALGFADAGARAAVLPPTCQGLPATIWGGAGNDVLIGAGGPDVIAGLGGDDTIWGLDDNDVLCGGPGNDVLRGMDGNDRIYGNSDDDVLYGGPGADFLDGGTHNLGDFCDAAPGGLPPVNCFP